MILHLYVLWGEGIAKDIKYHGSRTGLSFEEQMDADQDTEWENQSWRLWQESQEEVFVTHILIPVGTWRKGPAGDHGPVFYHKGQEGRDVHLQASSQPTLGIGKTIYSGSIGRSNSHPWWAWLWASIEGGRQGRWLW